MDVTREWVASDDPIVQQRRELAILRLRAQYWLLDPYIRGRGVYHRHGNVSSLFRPSGQPFEANPACSLPKTLGNGLVTFEYPSNDNTEGEWETLGYTTCREELLLQIAALEKDLQAQGVDVSRTSSTGGRNSTRGNKMKRSKSQRD